MPRAFSTVHARVFAPTAVVGTILLAFPATLWLAAAAGVFGLLSVLTGAVLLSREQGQPRWPS